MPDWTHKNSQPPNKYKFQCGTVYVLCWEAGHYIGFSTDVIRRLEQHRNGVGSNTTKKAILDGYELVLVEIYQHTNTIFEAYLQENFICPRCGYTGPMKIKLANFAKVI